MRQETPHPLPVLDYGRPPRGSRRLAVVKGVTAGVVAVMFLLQWRLLSFALLGLAMVPCALALFRRKKYLRVAAWVVCASSFLPFDVALGNYHVGSRYGTSPGGPHFVRFVVGMPRRAYLLRTYGEYISAGCVSSNLFPPQWIWVWD